MDEIFSKKNSTNQEVLEIRLQLFANGYEPIAARGKRPAAKAWSTTPITLERIVEETLKFPDAVMYPKVSYLEVLSKGLGVMDSTAIAMCRDNQLPIRVFNLNIAGNIMRMSMGENVGTLIN